MNDSNGTIIIKESETSKQLLRNVGKFIGDLKIDYYTNWNESVEMLGLVNRYCTALTNLEIRTSDKNVLDAIVKPFSGVTSASFIGNFSLSSNKRFFLNEIFPKLQNLTLQTFESIDSERIEHFPDLKDLAVAYPSVFQIDEEHIKRIIKWNLQIRYVKLRACSLSAVKFVNDILQNLESLELDLINEYPQLDEGISLNKVKYLKVSSILGDYLERITAQQLQELKMISHMVFPNLWIEFLIKHAKLSKLTIKTGVLQNDQLLRLAGRMPHLKNISMNIARDVPSNTVIQFMEQNNNLQMLNLKIENSSANVLMDAIQYQFGAKWSIINTTMGYLIEKM